MPDAPTPETRFDELVDVVAEAETCPDCYPGFAPLMSLDDARAALWSWVQADRERVRAEERTAVLSEYAAASALIPRPAAPEGGPDAD